MLDDMNTPFEWPHDTAFLQYNGTPALVQVVISLEAMGQPFAVSPKHGQIAMSQAAARSIGLL